MSASTVRGFVAAKVATLPSVRHVYSAVPATGVNPIPFEYVDSGPHALVVRGNTTRQYGTGNQWVTRAVDVEFRFSGLEPGAAERLIDTLEGEILTVFSAGITQGGAVIDLLYSGSDKPYEELDRADRSWYVWVAHFEARERYAIEMTA